MILLENVSFSFKDGEILHDVNLEVKNGQFVGVIGANGAGKTTLIRLMLGLLKPSSGKVVIDEKSVAYVAQTTSLNDGSFPATVEEVVYLGLAKMKPTLFSYRNNKKKLNDILEEFGLTEFRHRIYIADDDDNIRNLLKSFLEREGYIIYGFPTGDDLLKRFITNPCDLIILDEPDAGMDHESHEKLIESIKELNKKKGKTIVFISHHLHDLEDADAIFQVKAGVVSTFEGGDEHAAL